MNQPAALALSLAIGASAFAGDETLLGNLGGVRPSLAAKGIDFSMHYTGEVFGNPVGGVKRGAIYEGMLELGVDVDLEKLAGWSGGKFHAGAIYPHGASGTENFVGDIGVFSNIDFQDSFRLFTLWLKQSFLKGRVSLAAGQLSLDDDFASSDFSAVFISSDFGNPSGFSNNVPEPIIPTLALGVRLRVQPFEGFHISLAAYDGNPATGKGDPSPNAVASNEFNRYGTHWALRSDEGALFAGEIGYAFNQPEPAPDAADKTGGKRVAEPRGLAGSYKMGVLHHTDTFANVFDNQLSDLGSSLARDESRSTRGNTIFYGVADQELWRKPGTDAGGLGAFARAVIGRSDRNFLRSSYEAGLVYRGLLQANAADQLGLGFSFSDVSPRIEDATRAANRRDSTHFTVPDYEAVLELTYKLQVTKWCAMQPDAQWIIHPGGSREIPDALVIGLRTAITF